MVDLATKSIAKVSKYGYLQQMPLRCARVLFISTFLVSLSQAGWAQQAPLPATADPGRVGNQQLQQLAPAAPTGEIDLRETDAAPHRTQNVPDLRFTLHKVNFKGANVYPTDVLKTYFADKMGKEISLKDLVAIADDITAKYRADGYILSKAMVPTQDIKNGVVTIEIIEGFIDSFKIQGNAGKANAQLTEYAKAIMAQKPLTTQTIERYLLLANDLPGLQVRTALIRSPDKAGAAHLTLFVEKKLVDAIATVDNRGSRYLGRGQVTTSAALNNVFNMNEQFSLQAAKALDDNELNYVGGGASKLVGNEGTRVGVQTGYTATEPGYILKAFDTKGLAYNFAAYVNHPLIRTRDENLFLSGQFDTRDVKNKQLGSVFSRDRIRALRAGATYQTGDSWNGVDSISAQGSQGLNILNATDNQSTLLSRFYGKSDFTKVNADYQRLQAVTSNVNLLFSTSGQYAFDSLLATEQFGLGGTSYARAYDFSEVVGDHGLAGKLELQYNLQPRLLNNLGTAQLYTFYDIGRVWQRKTLIGQQDATSLASTGLGIRIKGNEYLSGYLEVAQPLSGDVSAEGDSDPRVFAGLTVRY